MEPAAHSAVLIIDDEEGIRAVLGAILDSIDITTFEAGDGQEALEILSQNKDRIKACMLDMNLEDTCGEELYDKLKAISPNIAVFAMSGIYGEEIRERLGERQIAGLISKPFSASDLVETVKQGLDSSK